MQILLFAEAVRSTSGRVIEDVDASDIHRFTGSGDRDGVVSCTKFSGAKDDWPVVRAGRTTDGAFAHSGLFISEVTHFNVRAIDLTGDSVSDLLGCGIGWVAKISDNLAGEGARDIEGIGDGFVSAIEDVIGVWVLSVARIGCGFNVGRC